MNTPSANQDASPPVPNSWAAWLFSRGGEITGVKVDYVMTGVETSKTVWHLTLSDGSKSTVDETDLREVVVFYPHRDVPGHRAIAVLKRELWQQCEARQKWEKSNARELAEYRRLHKKYGGTP